MSTHKFTLTTNLDPQGETYVTIDGMLVYPSSLEMILDANTRMGDLILTFKNIDDIEQRCDDRDLRITDLESDLAMEKRIAYSARQAVHKVTREKRDLAARLECALGDKRQSDAAREAAGEILQRLAQKMAAAHGPAPALDAVTAAIEALGFKMPPWIACRHRKFILQHRSCGLFYVGPGRALSKHISQARHFDTHNDAALERTVAHTGNEFVIVEVDQ